jgi:23S rRNA (cytosine1962-C5)-methyltransferase
VSNRPLLRVNPKQAARLKSGVPWVYSNEIVMDRATKTLAPGSLVDVTGEQGNSFGTATLNPHSLIAARILSPDRTASIDKGFFAQRFETARRLRDALMSTPFYRLIHAEADGCPGLVIDRFDDVFVAQSGTAGMDSLEIHWLAALTDMFAPRAIFIKNDAPARAHEGLADDVRCAFGDETARVTVEEGGVIHHFAPTAAQKTGWYFDQRDNREFLVRLSGDKSVLDAFSYTGALALAAARHGAKRALMLDSSAPALEQAMMTARKNHLPDTIEARRCDAMIELEAMGPQGERFDIVSCDPPPFVRARKDLEAGARGYRKLARLCAELVSPGGLLCIASCSHAISAERFQQECAIGIHRTGRQARLIRVSGAGPDHPVHPMLPETAYLKSLVYCLD